MSEGVTAGGQRQGAARRHTLGEVAAAAGVSPATVSRVINGFRYISPQVRVAVERAIDELGYVPNRAARTLVTRRTDSIALIVCEPQERLYADPYFAIMARALTLALADTDLQLVLLMARTQQHRRRAVSYAVNGHVDGVLLTSVHGSDPLPHTLVQAGVPLVLNGPPAATGVPLYVDVDNVRGGQQAAQHLRSAGRRRFTMIAGPADMRSAADRLDGFRRGVVRLSRNAVVHGDYGMESGRNAMSELLSRVPDLDAVFVGSDQMAMGALQVLHRAGRRIPDDVAVVGFDDIPEAPFADPPLTTFHQPFDDMAQAMVTLLLSQIQDRRTRLEPIVLPAQLVVRESG
ncbi:MAG TPA: LacI family DNA-binding transcriptional regulator [Mycobacteriales bacterium]|nr:LacI family DNA-binding transcriptional regulator [Mycobacteriales bacterium]